MKTNAPEQSQLKLIITGQIRKFVTIKPSRVKLAGVVGEHISKKVTIIPETEIPFNVVKVTHLGSKNFSSTYKEIEYSGKKAYEITIVNLKKDEGRYHDQLIVITDRTDRAPLKVYVDGYIRGAKPAVEKPKTETKLESGVKAKPEAAPEVEPGKSAP